MADIMNANYVVVAMPNYVFEATPEPGKFTQSKQRQRALNI